MDFKIMIFLLKDHFNNSMPVSVDNDYAQHLLDRIVSQVEYEARLDELYRIDSLMGIPNTNTRGKNQNPLNPKNLTRFATGYNSCYEHVKAAIGARQNKIHYSKVFMSESGSEHFKSNGSGTKEK